MQACIEVREVREPELQHVAAFRPRPDRDGLAELARELPFEPTRLNVDGGFGSSATRGRFEQQLDRLLDFARRPAKPHDLAREPHLSMRIERQQRTCVPHVERAGDDRVFHAICQLEQPQEVRHAGARTTERFGDLVVRHAELFDEPRHRLRLIDRIQILAL